MTLTSSNHEPDPRTFTHRDYTRLLRTLRKHYQIVTLSEAPKAEPPYLILTHNVDLSLGSAVDMALIENALGIHSTYFVLFSSKLYNIFESAGNSRIRMMRFIGHEIGLHCDLKSYVQYPDVDIPLKLEVGALGMQIGCPVTSVSLHQSELSETNPLLDVPPLLCDQNPELYDFHVSDSFRAWDEGTLDKLLSLKCDRVKLSIHPGFWTEEKIDRHTALSKVLERSGEERRYKYLVELLDYWNQHPKVEAYESDS